MTAPRTAHQTLVRGTECCASAGLIDRPALRPCEEACIDRATLRWPNCWTTISRRGFWRSNMKANGTVMKSNGTLAIVQSIYDHVHLALWATLVAFVVFFLAFVVP